MKQAPGHSCHSFWRTAGRFCSDSSWCCCSCCWTRLRWGWSCFMRVFCLWLESDGNPGFLVKCRRRTCYVLRCWQSDHPPYFSLQSYLFFGPSCLSPCRTVLFLVFDCSSFRYYRYHNHRNSYPHLLIKWYPGTPDTLRFRPSLHWGSSSRFSSHRPWHGLSPRSCWGFRDLLLLRLLIFPSFVSFWSVLWWESMILLLTSCCL